MKDVLSPTSVHLFWNKQPGIDEYEVTFTRSPANGSESRHTQCDGFEHNDTKKVGTATEYTLMNLEEDSLYTITLSAVYFHGSEVFSSKPVLVTTEQDGLFSIGVCIVIFSIQVGNRWLMPYSQLLM